MRTRRRARIAELGRRTALVALVGLSGVAGMGAATLPGFMPSAFTGQLGPHRVTLDQSRRLPPIAAVTSWGQPVLLHCYACGDGITCFVIEGD